MLLVVLIIIWFIIDLIRYFYYIKSCDIINNYTFTRTLNHTNIVKMLEDMKKYPDVLKNTIEHIFYSSVRLEDMNFSDVCNSLLNLVNNDKQYIDTIGIMVSDLQKYEKQVNNRSIFMGNTYHKRMYNNYTDIKSWFFILPLYLLTTFLRILIHRYMICIGYKQCTTKNGIKIWYSDYDAIKGDIVVFFHSSLGGTVTQYNLLWYFFKEYNIIMPEIPGISFIWLQKSHYPPTIDNITDDVNDFIGTYYKNSDTEQYNISPPKVNIIGHSIGSTICSAYLNKYPNNIDNFFCIEGQIFFNGSVKVYELFNSDLSKLDFFEMLSVPLFHRYLYTQFFIHRYIHPDKCCIYDLNEDNNKHIKIHMFHVNNDTTVYIKPQIDYAFNKKIPVSYYITQSDNKHGSFVTDRQYQNKTIRIIHKILHKF